MMNKNTILITGAASGIGLAAARHFHKMGYWVGMADLNLALLKDVTKPWDHARVRLFQLDVSDFTQAQNVVAEFCAEHNNSLAVLLNNAGILEIGPFEDIPIEQHQRTLSVNVIGVMNLCHAAWPYLNNNGTSTIINMSSASSDYGVPELASYSASKFAVKALTEALELEWQKYGISVCDVMPPFVATNMLKSQKNTAKVMQRLGVNITAEDVVAVIDKQVRQPKTHRTVSVFYGLLHRLSNVSPALINRLAMKFLSR
ncbi:MAG: SDR family oxidoreductase [Shewanella psychromarinicola]|uniref:SDR family oxidoreductase n=1 Tax=Shewanella psychromarinicola TaxID=2487742 RepID=UPI003002EA33